jgi:hypothetical protein
MGQKVIHIPQSYSLDCDLFGCYGNRIPVIIGEGGSNALCGLRCIVGLKIVLCDQGLEAGGRRSTLRDNDRCAVRLNQISTCNAQTGIARGDGE